MGSPGPPLEGLLGAGIWKGQKAWGSWAHSVNAASLTCAPREVMGVACSLLSERGLYSCKVLPSILCGGP